MQPSFAPASLRRAPPYHPAMADDSRIVLVSGPPGAGKTTLARPLAKALGFALLSKDDIKEPLFDTLGGVRGDHEASQRIGAASWEVLWALAPHIPHLVLEANFHPNSAYEHARLAALPGQIVEVYCRCPPAEVARRFAARAARPEHHAAHYAGEVSQSVIVSEFGRPMGIGTVIEVDTRAAVDIAALADRIRALWTA
jgi:predicted kinase